MLLHFGASDSGKVSKYAFAADLKKRLLEQHHYLKPGPITADAATRLVVTNSTKVGVPTQKPDGTQTMKMALKPMKGLEDSVKIPSGATVLGALDILSDDPTAPIVKETITLEGGRVLRKFQFQPSTLNTNA
jgi:hypothetical protein